MKIFQRVFICLLLLTIHYPLFTSSAFADSNDDRIAELQKQIEELEHQKTQVQSNIAGTQAQRASLQQEINLIKNNVQRLQLQIKLTGQKITKTATDIKGLEGKIFDTQQDIDKQKVAIGRMMLALNRGDQEDLLLSLIKTRQLSEIFRQQQYTANLSTELVDLVEDLSEVRDALEEDKQALEGNKNELQTLNQQQNAQKTSLDSANKEKNKLLVQTKGQEAAYLKQLTAIERKQAEFYTELQKLENSVVAGGLYIVHVVAKSLPPKKTHIFSWPLTGYRLTQGYGMTKYAKRGAYGGAPHNGLDIASGYGDPVKAIGAGEIIAFGFNDGFGNWIAVRHPPYDVVSLYGHLEAYAGLRVGAMVEKGTLIGYEGSTGHSTGAHVHLSIYKDFFTYEKKGQLYFNYFEGSLNPLDYL